MYVYIIYAVITRNSAIYGAIKHVPHACLIGCVNKRNHLKMSIKLRISNVCYSFQQR